MNLILIFQRLKRNYINEYFKSNISSRIQIKSKTWKRDSHGLFDYENNQVKSTTMIINKNGILSRHNDDMRFVSSLTSENSEEAKELAVVKFLDSMYLVIYTSLKTNST